MRTLESCIKQLKKKNDTSINVWCNYWQARRLLRELALKAYQDVTKAYAGKDLSFPTEGFKDIASDYHETMKCFEDDFPGS